MKRTLNPLKHYTALCDKAETNHARVELWVGRGNKELQTLRVVTDRPNRRSHCTPIIDHDLEEAAQRILKKNIF